MALTVARSLSFAQEDAKLNGTWDFLFSRGGQLGDSYIHYPSEQKNLSLVFTTNFTKQAYKKDSLIYNRSFTQNMHNWLDYGGVIEKESFQFRGADTLIITPRGADRMSDWYVRRKPQAKKP